MAKQTSRYLPKATRTASVIFLTADGIAQKLLIAAGVEGTDIRAMVLTSSETTQIHNVNVWLKKAGGSSILIGTCRVLALSGLDGTVGATDGFSAANMPYLTLDAVSKRFMPLAPGDEIYVNPILAATAGKGVAVTVFAQDY